MARIAGNCLAIALLAALAGWQDPSAGATLRVGRIEAASGKAGIEVPITLADLDSQVVAAIQFDLRCDAGALKLEDIAPGDNIASAGKNLSSFTLDPGRRRIIIIGMNQNPVPAGALAVLRLSAAAEAAPGAYPIDLSNQILSDPTGVEIKARAESGAVVIGREAPGTMPSSAPRCGCFGGALSDDGSRNNPGVWAAMTALLLLSGRRSRTHPPDRAPANARPWHGTPPLA